MMTKDELIEYYQQQLVKVKNTYNPENYHSHDEIARDRCNAYITGAEQQIEEVRNGRNW